MTTENTEDNAFDGITAESATTYADIPLHEEAEPEPDELEAAEESASDEAEASDEGQDGDQGTEEAEERRNKKPAKERIAELTAKFREEERKRQAAEEAQKAKDAELEALRRQIYGEPEKKDGRPDPKAFQDGEYDPAYQDALIEWKTSERVREEIERFRQETERQRQSEQQRRAMEDFQSRMGADEDHGADAYELFVEHVSNPAAVPMSPEMAAVFVNAPEGIEIMAHLNRNRAELSRISALPAPLQAYELAKLARKPAEKASIPALPRTTKAPDPLPEAKGRRAVASKAPADMSPDEYKRWADRLQKERSAV